jgi:long-chain acyl-CoA synthetase
MNFATRVNLTARNAPTALAVGDRNRSVTFKQLTERSDRIADGLADRGVEAGEHVALDLPNGVPFVYAYLGVLKRGAVAVPINTRFTDQQIRYVLSDSGAVCVVTNGAGDGVEYRYADLLESGTIKHKTTPRRGEELAELLYTSGTTGAPKGVYHTHENLAANADGYIRYNGWHAQDVALTVCPCFHVTGLNITTTPFLALGAENHLLEAWDIESFLEAIEHHGVTYTFLIPTMVVELLEYEGTDAYDTSTLQSVGVGGSPMPKKRIEEAEQIFDCALLEGYGMTETTPLAALNHLGPNGCKPGSVGRPAREAVEVRIEDPQTGEVVEQGERGELLWRGDTVTPRYNKHQLTESTFVERAGKRWLKSGDIGWMDEERFLFIVDRIEDMFTTGCGDVSPREIEAVIYSIDPVQKVAIIDRPDDVRGATVTAIVKRRSEESVSAADIKRACKRELQSHEVPDRVVFIEKFSHTATGKIDRSALRSQFG